MSLKLRIGTELDGALLRVSNKSARCGLPENAERPVITASGAQSSPAI